MWLLRVAIEANHATHRGRNGGILFEYERIVARDNHVLGAGKRFDFIESFHRGEDVMHGRKRRAPFHVGVQVCDVRREYEITTPRENAYGLNPLRVPSDVVKCDARSHCVGAMLKANTPSENAAHHLYDIFFLERMPQRVMTHRATGAVRHFAVLHVKARLREQVMIPAMIVMKMRENNIFDLGVIDTDGAQSVVRLQQKFAAALASCLFVKSGIDDERTPVALDRPKLALACRS